MSNSLNITVPLAVAVTCLEALERSLDEQHHYLKSHAEPDEEAELEQSIEDHEQAIEVINQLIDETRGTYYVDQLSIRETWDYGAHEYPESFFEKTIHVGQWFHSFEDALSAILSPYTGIGTTMGDWITNVGGERGTHTLLVWIDADGNPDADGFPVELVWRSAYAEKCDGAPDEGEDAVDA